MRHNNTKPIIALDFANIENTMACLEQLSGQSPLFVKVGMELFYQQGPSLVTHLKGLGHQVFLDLKLHDIPNTVKSAMRGLAKLNVDMVNVHAVGGIRMMQAAKEGLEQGCIGNNRPRLIAVTQLTSTTEGEMQHDQGLNLSLMGSVLHYSRNAYQAGLDGVVCSAHEAQQVKQVTDSHFLCVTPGIRLTAADDDQRRVMTPAQAKLAGATHIVVGRPITQAGDIAAAYQQVKQQWEQA